jgi:hypothetical protein
MTRYIGLQSKFANKSLKADTFTLLQIYVYFLLRSTYIFSAFLSCHLQGVYTKISLKHTAIK